MSIHTLNDIYTKEEVDSQKTRYQSAKKEFEQLFGVKPTNFFSAPGRTEVGGNHTDHNHGCVLAAAVSLDVIAMVIPTDDNVIQIKSQGFLIDVVDISNLEVHNDEINTSAALIRGVAAGFAKNGHKIGGFKAYTTSTVLKGSGLSSSAAFEVLVSSVLNGLYNNHSISDIEIAQISQYAENAFFGKPSGLLDQMAASVGGFITIDFAQTGNPIIQSIDFDFENSGHSLCIVDTKGNHADLTPDYAAIPSEMKSIAGYYGKNVLREISKDNVIKDISVLREKFGDRAVLRAFHFFDENVRVEKEAIALKNNNFDEFLDVVKQSGESSYMYLQNVYASSAPSEQGLSTALYMAEQILDGEGAFRVHGGGFAGTIQAFVPNNKLETFKNQMNNIFGDGSCYVLSIRHHGGVEIKL